MNMILILQNLFKFFFTTLKSTLKGFKSFNWKDVNWFYIVVTLYVVCSIIIIFFLLYQNFNLIYLVKVLNQEKDKLSFELRCSNQYISVLQSSLKELQDQLAERRTYFGYYWNYLGTTTKSGSTSSIADFMPDIVGLAVTCMSFLGIRVVVDEVVKALKYHRDLDSSTYEKLCSSLKAIMNEFLIIRKKTDALETEISEMDLRLRLFFKAINSWLEGNEATWSQLLKLISDLSLEKTVTPETLTKLGQILFELLKKYFGGD